MANTRPCPTDPYHSDTLDAKIAEGGHRYGKNQAAETLALVGGVDVDGIMAELKGEKGAAAVQEVEEVRREKKLRNGYYICQYCGKEFKAPRKKKYCSVECQKVQARINKYGIRNCKICGEEFIPRREEQMTCCARHGQLWAMQNGRGPGRRKKSKEKEVALAEKLAEKHRAEAEQLQAETESKDMQIRAGGVTVRMNVDMDGDNIQRVTLVLESNNNVIDEEENK